VADQKESRVLQEGRIIDALSYSPDGRYLVESSMDHRHGGIRVHDLMSTDPARSLTTRPSRRAVFSPDGRTIAGAPDHRLTLWDAKTKRLLGTLTEPKLADRMADPNYHALIQEMGAEIGALAFSPDGDWLAAGVGGPHTFGVDAPQKVMVFNVAQREEHATFATPTQVNAVAFSADGKLLAAAGHNGTIWMWDTSSWDEIGRWQGPADTGYGAILFLQVSLLGDAGPLGDRPGYLLATGSRSGRIDLWDVNTRALVRQMHGHISLISVMALSPDGRTLATASCDGSIKLWDGGTGRELRTIYRQEEWMYALAFSPDGNTLASGGGDELLRLWEASPKESVAAELAELDSQAKTSRPQ
jgi:WD40 repeat protein